MPCCGSRASSIPAALSRPAPLRQSCKCTSVIPQLHGSKSSSCSTVCSSRQQFHASADMPCAHHHQQRRRASNAPTRDATVTLRGAGLPLLLGLRQLPAGVSSLVGWQVQLSGSSELVGTVVQVESLHTAYDLLHICKDSILQPYGFKGREAHNIPLVPAIVDKLHPQERVLTITPPPGLLDLGRRELLLSFLSRELLQYAPRLPHPAGEGGHPLVDIRCMPTRQQLVDAGRADLVGMITKVGGFTEAALLLGLRATRRPVGYWDSLEVLDAELDAFIAGCWVAFPVVDEHDNVDGLNRSGLQQQAYFYNMATRSIRWELPAAARALLPQLPLQPPSESAAASTSATGTATDDHRSGDDEGLAGSGDTTEEDQQLQRRWFGMGGQLNNRAVQRALMALAEDRVMPSRNCLKAAGRWDLHNAIIHNGGYKEVAEMLERRLSWPVPQPLVKTKALSAALAELVSEQGWDARVLPSLKQLRQADRDDIIKAISHHGGWRATAKLLRLQCTRTPAGKSAADVAEGLLNFMVTTPPASIMGNMNNGTAGHPRSSGHISRIARVRLKQHGAGKAAAAVAGGGAKQHSWPRMPTQRELLESGRADLVAGLQRHGHETIRMLLRLPEPKRKRLHKGVLKWEAVRAAIGSGCNTIPAILTYITQHAKHEARAQLQQPQPDQECEQAGQWQRQGHQIGSNVPLVTSVHLGRQLKAWCQEGRLVKTSRGCYELSAAEQYPII